MAVQDPIAVWKAASARERAVLASGVLVLAAGIAWAVWTAVQRHVSPGEFTWVFFQCLIVTGAVMAVGQRVARTVARERRRRRNRAPRA